MTWRAAHRHVQNDMLGARDAMRAALRAHRRGDDERVERVLVAEVGSEDEAEDAEMEAEEEEEEEEADAILEEEPASTIVPFSGAGHRLCD